MANVEQLSERRYPIGPGVKVLNVEGLERVRIFCLRFDWEKDLDEILAHLVEVRDDSHTPKKTFAMIINLIKQGHEAALRRPVDLVNAGGCDASSSMRFRPQPTAIATAEQTWCQEAAVLIPSP